MRAVNLLPYADQASSSWRGAASTRFSGVNQLWLSGAFAGLTATVLAALFLLSSSTLSEKRDELRTLEAERAAIAPKADQVNAKLAERKSREAALAAALQERIAWDRLLRRVSQVLPSEVVTTGLKVSSPSAATETAGATGATGATTTAPAATAAPGSAPEGFTLTAYGSSQDVAAQTLRRLALLPELTNVQLVSSIETKLDRVDVFLFTIAGDVVQRGAEQ
jgi:Tfp pilus assembly protein PilN